MLCLSLGGNSFEVMTVENKTQRSPHNKLTMAGLTNGKLPTNSIKRKKLPISILDVEIVGFQMYNPISYL